MTQAVVERERVEGAGRAEVLAAAAAVFTRRGYAAASMDEVARETGATKGRVYHYWRSKLDLFVDAACHGVALIHDAVTTAEAEGPQDAAARMDRMIRAHLRSILRDRPFHRVAVQSVEMHQSAATTPDQRDALAGLMALRDRHEAAFARVIAEGQAEGAFAPGAPGVITRTILPALNGAVFWYRPRAEETDADRERIVDDIAGFALRGLLARNNPGRTE